MTIDVEPPERPFASDNWAGAHPAVIEAVSDVNLGHGPAYGGDEWTKRLEDAFRELFDTDLTSLVTYNGTGANVLAMGVVLGRGEAVVCTPWSHITADETGAPERILGSKLIEVPSDDGKITPDSLETLDHLLGVQHHAQPGVVSLTQATELGTVYTLEEVAAVTDAAHERGMRIHVDGARIANAVAAMGGGVENLREMTVGTGVDVITFGGTKNGAMGAEAVIIFNPDLTDSAPYLRKQFNQLASKMRFVSAQLLALIADDLWLDLAKHANEMATRLYHMTSELPGVTFNSAPEANGLFPLLPADVIDPLKKWSPFVIWDHTRNQVRWMTSWDSTEADVERFAAGVRAVLSVR